MSPPALLSQLTHGGGRSPGHQAHRCSQGPSLGSHPDGRGCSVAFDSVGHLIRDKIEHK